ncbi:MAG: dynamin family protein [Streptomyces sp.]|nr:dynamin family protein [Streptomyces sp.]
MLRTRAEAAFERAALLLTGPEFAAARARLDDIRRGFAAGLHVVLLGRVSAGKSTLVNALLEEDRAPTGSTELTFHVTRLHHAPDATLTLHYRDGRPPRTGSPDDFRTLVTRAHHDPDRHAELRAVDHLDLGLPNRHLTHFDLVDTPGLDSWLGEDSARTLRFLGRTGADVRTATVDHAGRADALVLVLASGLAESEERLLEDVTGTGLRGVEPLTAVGALTKTEYYWPSCPDPLAEGRRVAHRLMHRSGAHRTLFDLVPVASLLATGATAATPAEMTDLTELATVEPAVLTARVRRGPYFATRDYADLPLPPERRRALLERFGGYGTVLACRLIRDGLTDTTALRDELLRRSNIPRLRTLLLEHFGNRADAVKLDHAVREAETLPDLAGTGTDTWVRWHIEEATGEIARLRLTEHVFQELVLLRRVYDGSLTLTPAETAEILTVTGERGGTPCERLGLNGSAHPDTLVRTALRRQAYWAAVDLDAARTPETAEAARIVRRCYDLLLDRVQGAPMPHDTRGAHENIGRSHP